MKTNHTFSSALLNLDYDQVVEKAVKTIRSILRNDLKRKGLVIAVSGGIDSSTVAALCTAAVGKDRVFNLLLPEQDSSPETYRLSRMVPEHLGVEYIEENITPILQAYGCYQRRNDAIRQVIPEFGDDWKCKIILPNLKDAQTFRLFSVMVESPDGRGLEGRKG